MSDTEHVLTLEVRQQVLGQMEVQRVIIVGQELAGVAC